MIYKDLKYCEEEALSKFGEICVAGLIGGCIRVQTLKGRNVGHAWYDKKDNSILHLWLINPKRLKIRV
jgi:hypothetical protein